MFHPLQFIAMQNCCLNYILFVDEKLAIFKFYQDKTRLAVKGLVLCFKQISRVVTRQTPFNELFTFDKNIVFRVMYHSWRIKTNKSVNKLKFKIV